MTLKTGRKNTGFSLIELLIVVGIIIVMLGISAPYFARFASKTKLEAAAINISKVLRTARSYAISNNSNYKVRFDVSTTPDQYWITDNLDTLVEKKYSLSQHIDFYRPSNPSDPINFTNDTAIFNSKGGLNGVDGSAWISLAPDHIKFKRITVDSTTGKVTIDETP